MLKRSILPTFLFLAGTLSSCAGPFREQPPPSTSPSLTPNPLLTPSPTQPRWLTTLQARWTAFPDALVPSATRYVPPTSTPFPLPESPPGPSTQVLIEFGLGGGDGGTSYDFLLGRDVPSLVLYPDGLLVMSGGSSPDNYLVSKRLSTTEVCQLLARIASTGFLDADGTGQSYPDVPIYKAYRDYGDGAGGYRIAVNGPRDKWAWIYGPAAENLVPPVAEALRLLDTYHPPGMEPYDPHRIILRVQLRSAADWFSPTPQTSIPWPDQLPPLQSLVTDEDSPREVLLTGTDADLLRPAFPAPTSGYFTQDGSQYFVVGRPALPHETERYYSAFPWASSSVTLQFSCGA